MKRTSMKKIKEVIRLKENGELSLRQISGAVNLSRPVVTKYLTIFKSSGLTYDEIKDFKDEEIYKLIIENPEGKRDNNDRYAVLSSKFEYLLKESKRKHMTLQKLWEEYIEENPDGYSRSQFFEHFARWRKSCELTMHLEHKAGDKMFVDFTGKKLYLTDRTTGKKIPADTFVAILPASHYTYVCATQSQKTDDWIQGTEEAFWYYGGATTAVTPDCYKSAVKKHNRFDPEINPVYSQFADHYDTVILPARPIHPKDKALVENAVKIVYSWIYASLRNEVFYTLQELNNAISNQLEKYNAKKMQTSGISRRELFEKIEENSLKDLPIALFERKEYSKATIQLNYHVRLRADKRYYSVPFRYYEESHRGKQPVKADIYYTRDNVEIYYCSERIAVHKRAFSGPKYITKPEHMPEKHRWYLERWNPEKIISLAKTKGPSVAVLVEKLINKHKHPEQSYNTCRGIIFLSRNYGMARLDKACRKALYLGYCSYNAVSDILKNNLEEMEVQPELFSDLLPEHANVRGKEYFKERLKEAAGE
jgi:transposase